MVNNFLSVLAFFLSLNCFAQTVRINEVQASNATTFLDVAGDFDDWIEVYNDGNEEIHLNGWHVSDDPNNLTKWTFPSEPEIELEPGEFLLLVADGEPDESLGVEELHLNFSLKQAGEQIFLSQPIGTVIHQVQHAFNWQDYSWGYDENDVWGLLESASPNTANTGTALDGSAAPAIFSVTGSLIAAPFTLTLEAATGASIRYTLDGSVPDESSPLYTEGISISQNTSVKTRTFENGKHPSKITSQSYLFENGLSNPVIHLSCEEAAFSGSEGLDENPFQDNEIIVDAAFFDENGVQEHQQNMGLKVHAADFRDQRSFRLYARGEYGERNLSLPVFEDRSYDDYTRLILRNAGNDGIEIAGAGLRDVLIHDLYRSIDDEYGVSATKAVNLFVNGEFWGLYNLRERQDRHWLNSVYGIEDDEVDYLERTAGEGDTRDELAGDWEAFDLFEQSAIDLDLSDDETYASFVEQMNLRNFIDYQALEIYIVNQDWLSNNMKFYKEHEEGSQWNWVIWDTDWGFGTYYPAYPHGFPDWNALNFATSVWGGWTSDVETELLTNLLMNDQFVADFSTRSADLMNSYLKPERVIEQLLQRKEIIENDVPRQIERWGGNLANWENEVEYMSSFIADRAGHNRLHYAEKFELGSIFLINLDQLPQAAGSIEVNTIEADVLPWSGFYFEALPVRLKAVAQPGFVFDHWEGENIADPLSAEIFVDMDGNQSLTAVYLEVENEGSPMINEVFYSSGGPEDVGDWIELYNSTSNAIDLSGWQFCANGDCFVFPSGVALLSDFYVVVPQDQNAFETLFEDENHFSVSFGFGLNQSGETLQLFDAEGVLRDEISYSNQDPWPNPVEQNHSIELVDENPANELGEHWMTQLTVPFGSPGAMNEIVPVNISEQEASLQVEVFPNPFQSFLSIQLPDFESGTYLITVRDLLGKTVRQMSKQHQKGEIMLLNDLSDLDAGTYLLELSRGNVRSQVKVLKR